MARIITSRTVSSYITTLKVVTSIKTTINFDKNSTLSRTLIIHILRDPSSKLPDGNYTRAHPRHGDSDVYEKKSSLEPFNKSPAIIQAKCPNLYEKKLNKIK